ILHGFLGLRLNGHASFVRPLIFPMSVGAAEAQKAAEPESLEEIKAADAASENYGNFYGQNLSVVQAGILLVYGVMKGLGYEVNLWRLILFTTPIVILSVILGAIQFTLFDRRLKQWSKAQTTITTEASAGLLLDSRINQPAKKEVNQ